MTDHNQNLTDLPEGSFAQVVDILASGGIRRRLLDLGVIEGTKIECVRRSPYGDPIAYLIRGAIIALRSEDSSTILVRAIN